MTHNQNKKTIGRLLTTAAVFTTLVLTATTYAQDLATAKIPVKVNVAASVSAAPSVGAKGSGASKGVAANAWDTLTISFAKGDPFDQYIENIPVSVTFNGQRRVGAGAMIRQNRGGVTLKLLPGAYDNAVIGLYALSGKRILSGKVASSKGAFSISRANVAPGVYLLSVKGAKGGQFTTKLSHKGGRFSINAAFDGIDISSSQKYAEAVYGETWGVTASAEGHYPAEIAFVPKEGINDPIEITLTARGAKANFTETITYIDHPGSEVSFDMIYVKGGTFTLGCDPAVKDSCPADAKPIEGVTVSDYYIGAVEVTSGLWRAVMGGNVSTSNSRYGSMTWYDAQEFACKLSERTGKNYRMQTEAEFEFAAKQAAAIGMGGLGGSEEWTYNTWSNTHSSVKQDPIGPGGPIHNQKTRRDAAGTRISDGHITGRLIRSIEGTGPALRLVISADMDYPPGMQSPCKIITPHLDESRDTNSYRDRRWITNDHYEWTSTFMSNVILKVWGDGTAVLGMVQSGSVCTDGRFCYGTTIGDWYTVNNFAFKIAPNDTTRVKLAYIFVSPDEVSVVSETSRGGSGTFMVPVGRMTRRPAEVTVTKPTRTPRDIKDIVILPEDQMWDMANIPEEAKGQDPRLLDRTVADPTGQNIGWFQNNCSAGGSHHYRKDVDPDEFRFTVGSMILANGDWFTVNNTFLRITHPTSGYVTDYLYAVTGTSDTSMTFLHNSFMGYERGDFRQFRKVTNGSSTFYACPPGTDQQPCGDACANEIPKGQSASMYNRQDNGQSTYVPPKCPSGGCK